MQVFKLREEKTGFIQDTFDPRDIWLDEVLGGDEVTLPPAYTIEGLPYEPQGGYPFCASFASTTMLEYLYNRDGMGRAFSQPHLFFHAGGSKVGSTFRSNLNVAKDLLKGVIPYSKFPMPNPKIGKPEGWFETMSAKAFATPFNEALQLTGYARVISDQEHLKQAIMAHGPILVGVSTKGGYYQGNAKRVSPTDNHAVLLVGWTPTQWQIFDSLWWVEKKGGYGTLDASYTFNSAYAITELPKNVKAKVEKVRSAPFEDALNHYGKPGDHEAEVRFANKMLDEFKRFNNQSVLDAAGRFWTVLINAGVYGGYSLSYTKYGMWQPGDLINFVYHWRRTGGYLFDLNQLREKN